MPVVEIVVPGPYAKREVEGNQLKIGVEYLKVGDIRQYEKHYTNVLVDNSLVLVLSEDDNLGDFVDLPPELPIIEEPAEKEVVEWNITPHASKLALELDIPLEKVVGTGKGGKITIQDVNTYARRN